MPGLQECFVCIFTGIPVVWVIDVGHVPVHWEDLEWISPQGGTQTDTVATAEGNRRELNVSPAVGGNIGGGLTVGE